MLSQGRGRETLRRYLLHDALVGNSKTFMLANVSPSESESEETLSTLRFASILYERFGFFSNHRESTPALWLLICFQTMNGPAPRKQLCSPEELNGKAN